MYTRYWQVKQDNAQLKTENSRERSSEWLVKSLLQLLLSQLVVICACCMRAPTPKFRGPSLNIRASATTG